MAGMDIPKLTSTEWREKQATLPPGLYAVTNEETGKTNYLCKMVVPISPNFKPSRIGIISAEYP